MRLATPGVLVSRSRISFKEDLIRNGPYYGEVEDRGRPGGWRAHVGRRRCVCRRECEQHHHGGEPGSDCSAEWWADIDLGRRQDAHASDQLRQPGRVHLVLCAESSLCAGTRRHAAKLREAVEELSR